MTRKKALPAARLYWAFATHVCEGRMVLLDRKRMSPNQIRVVLVPVARKVQP
jgi:hypothetical protein